MRKNTKSYRDSMKLKNAMRNKKAKVTAKSRNTRTKPRLKPAQIKPFNKVKKSPTNGKTELELSQCQYNTGPNQDRWKQG